MQHAGDAIQAQIASQFFTQEKGVLKGARRFGITSGLKQHCTYAAQEQRDLGRIRAKLCLLNRKRLPIKGKSARVFTLPVVDRSKITEGCCNSRITGRIIPGSHFQRSRRHKFGLTVTPLIVQASHICAESFPLNPLGKRHTWTNRQNAQTQPQAEAIPNFPHSREPDRESVRSLTDPGRAPHQTATPGYRLGFPLTCRSSRDTTRRSGRCPPAPGWPVQSRSRR